MKPKIVIQIILLLFFAGLTLTQCCEETICPDCPECEVCPDCPECEDCPSCENPEEPQYHTVFDSLQGVWSYFNGYNSSGQIDLGFKTTIHIANINRDSTMYYETYKNDTLKKSGILKIFHAHKNYVFLEPNISLHFVDKYPLDKTYIAFYYDTDHFEIGDQTRDDMPYYLYERIK